MLFLTWHDQLIIISGFPCSGKTRRSEQLVKNFEERVSNSSDPKISSLKIHLVNDESLGVSRTVYHTARAEKDARAEEMSAVKRFLGKDTIVIADGLNYIKGYRYQLYCEAKALQTPSCVVWTKFKEVSTLQHTNLSVDSRGQSYGKMPRSKPKPRVRHAILRRRFRQSHIPL